MTVTRPTSCARCADDWRPTASRDLLRLRAQMLARIRVFFAERNVMEVETPLLSASTVTDPHLASLSTRCRPPARDSEQRVYLQTSPEFAMKRLLAAGSGPIFQICKAFRDGEAGRWHNPEFTLLEWYRPGYDHLRLMDEVEELVGGLLRRPTARRMTYAEVFKTCVGADPFAAGERALARLAVDLGLSAESAAKLDRAGCLDFVFSAGVQPALRELGCVLIRDFPASQAALARVSPHDRRVAERFEMLVDGIELANGYHELSDAGEQRSRFLRDLATRKRLGATEPPLDERLLAALEHGLPKCAGVAVGVDRLLMLAAGVTDIRQVLAFPIDRA